MIQINDIVQFRKIYKINIEDLIARKNYSKYMIVLEIMNHVKPACKVMCANGEINWVAVSRLEKVIK
tara:strand:+ start:176 stop:376 length:201 start_codon:yes stop_codon:yes gene_type:complete